MLPPRYKPLDIQVSLYFGTKEKLEKREKKMSRFTVGMLVVPRISREKNKTGFL